MAKLIQERLFTSSRYEESVQIKASAGLRAENRLELSRRRFLQREDFEDQPGTIQYVLRQGDRLDILAYRLLGDSRLWWILTDINREQIPDTLNLQAGTEILVPSVERIARYL